jgi:hypothetical protein
MRNVRKQVEVGLKRADIALGRMTRASMCGDEAGRADAEREARACLHAVDFAASRIRIGRNGEGIATRSLASDGISARLRVIADLRR